ncbi:MAG: hypothetical protein K8T10_07525 [Candidatus Eremiobacteraeota bacterium]|nr:hypothetical protein [Candidatus Eremiobacteraeota bacterium]
MKVKKISLIILILISIMTLTVYKNNRILLASNKKQFFVEIMQDGKEITVRGHQVSLKKSPFTLIVYFEEKSDANILVNASLSPDSFESAQKGKSIDEIAGFKETGMAEESMNENRYLMISKCAPHYWYYKNRKDHRFNGITEMNGELKCRRTVEKIMLRDTTREYVDIEKIDQNEIYFVFMKAKWNKDFTKKTEVQRDYLKIKFVKENKKG